MLFHFFLFVLVAHRTRASPTASVAPYTFVGCWTEPENARALTAISYATDAMTLEYCAANCAGLYEYWGVEYGRECYCGNSLSPGTAGAPAADCSFLCSGNSGEVCGGSDRLSLYRATTPIPQAPTPSAVPEIGAYKFSNCQTEGTGIRALTGLEVVSDYMTNEMCASACVGYSMFATEYSRECYCGNSLEYGSIPAPISDCTFPCGGSSLELCGAALRLNLYTLRPTSTSRTLGPKSTSRTTSVAVYVTTSASASAHSSLHTSTSALSHQKSTSSSSSSKHKSSSSTATTHPRSTASLSKPISTRPSSSTHAVSSPKSTHISSISFLTASHRTTSSSNRPVQSSTKTPTSSLAFHTPGWSHVGCFSDVRRNIHRAHDMHGHNMHLLLKSHTMNPALCISAASARRTAKPATTYHYVGLEHGRDCYAATAAPSPIPTSLVGRKACTNTCAGNKHGRPVEMCGGWRQYDLYASVTGKVFSGPLPTATPS